MLVMKTILKSLLFVVGIVMIPITILANNVFGSLNVVEMQAAVNQTNSGGMEYQISKWLINSGDKGMFVLTLNVVILAAAILWAVPNKEKKQQENKA